VNGSGPPPVAAIVLAILNAMPALASPWVDFERARAMVELGDDQNAAVAYQSAIERDSRHARAHNDLGLLFARHGNAAAAEASFSASVEADPDNAIARTNLGAMLLQRGAAAPAYEQFTAALNLAPGFASARNGRRAAAAALGLPVDES
jgi:Flp pilus assembly protein TadD